MLKHIIQQIQFYKYRIIMLLLILFSIALSLSLIFASTPFNPIQNKLTFVKTIFNVTPQGWAFFTRDAREVQIYIYKIENNKLNKINQKHSNFDNFIGLSRKVSKLAIEMENVTGKIIKKNVSTPTTWNNDANITDEIPTKTLKIQNPINNPTLCGDYLIVYHEIPPWAWSNSRKKLKMPADVIKLKVLCQE